MLYWCFTISFSGIALKKVEQQQNAKKEEANGTNGQTDVASILARRVAVEMSDSDNENASDSEYDSDDWGDESTAWHKSKLLKQRKEYFFKSQESLATVIDNDEDEEEADEADHPDVQAEHEDDPPAKMTANPVVESKNRVEKNMSQSPSKSSKDTDENSKKTNEKSEDKSKTSDVPEDLEKSAAEMKTASKKTTNV